MKNPFVGHWSCPASSYALMLEPDGVVRAYGPFVEAYWYLGREPQIAWLSVTRDLGPYYEERNGGSGDPILTTLHLMVRYGKGLNAGLLLFNPGESRYQTFHRHGRRAGLARRLLGSAIPRDPDTAALLRRLVVPRPQNQAGSAIPPTQDQPSQLRTPPQPSPALALRPRQSASPTASTPLSALRADFQATWRCDSESGELVLRDDGSARFFDRDFSARWQYTPETGRAIITVRYPQNLYFVECDGADEYYEVQHPLQLVRDALGRTLLEVGNPERPASPWHCQRGGNQA